MKKILYILLLLVSLKGFSQIDPTKGTVSNRSYSPAQAVPTDFRSMYWDNVNFVARDYQNVAEVNAYLNLPKYRSGGFPIYIHFGGTLNSGIWTGGTRIVYWYKDGVLDANLVPMIPITSVNGQVSGGVVIGNADSLRNRKFDTLMTTTKQAAYVGYDSINHVFKLYPAPSGGSGNVNSVSVTSPLLNVGTSTDPNIAIPNAIADGSTKGASTYTASDFNTVSGLVSIDYPNGQKANGSQPGFLSSADWTAFRNKVTTVNGQTGNAIVKNADSIMGHPIDTGSYIPNNYVIGYDSASQTWVMMQNDTTGGGGGGGTVTSVSRTNGYGINASVASPTTTPNITIAVDTTTGIKTENYYNTKYQPRGIITGLITAGSNVTITGSGTTLSPYNISATGGGGGIDTTVLDTLYVRKTNILGTLFSESHFTSGNLAANFTNNGAVTPTISSNRIQIAATTNGTYAQSVDITGIGNSCLENWHIFMRHTVNVAASASTNGPGIGMRSSNSFAPSSIVAYVDLTSGGGFLYIINTYPSTNVVATSATALSYSNGDSLEYTLDRKGNVFYATARNASTNSAIVYAYGIMPTDFTSYTAVPQVMPNTGHFSIFTVGSGSGGSYFVDSLSVTSVAPRRANVMFLGDSKTVAYFGDFTTRWANLVGQSFSSFIVSAGGGDRAAEIVSRLPEIKMLMPDQIIAEYGTNDALDSNTYKSNEAIITAQLQTAGITVYHTCFYQSGNLWRWNYLQRTYPGYTINTYDATSQNGATEADGHLTNYGDSLVYAAIIASGKLKGGNTLMPFTLNSGSSASGSFINNSTALQSAANFNISGIGRASNFVISGTPSVQMSSGGSSSDGIVLMQSIGATDLSTNLYMSPKGAGGAGGANQTAFLLFNTDYIADPSNWGAGVFQSKSSSFKFYTLKVGTGTLQTLDLGTGTDVQLSLKTNGTSEFTGAIKSNDNIGIGISPNYPLHIAKAGTSLSAGGFLNAAFFDNSGARGTILGYDNDRPNAGLIASNGGPLEFWGYDPATTWHEYARMDSMGIFLINQTTAVGASKFQINDSLRVATLATGTSNDEVVVWNSTSKVFHRISQSSLGGNDSLNVYNIGDLDTYPAYWINAARDTLGMKTFRQGDGIVINAAHADSSLEFSILARANAFSANGDTVNIQSNHYSPTATSVTNVASVSANDAVYSRSGNVVTVSGSGSVTPTANTSYTRFSLTLPITMQGASTGILNGVISVDGTTTIVAGPVSPNNLTTGILSFLSFGTGAVPYTYTYQYEIKP